MECDIMTLRGVSLVFIALRILLSVSQSLVPNGQPVLLLFLLLLLLLLSQGLIADSLQQPRQIGYKA